VPRRTYYEHQFEKRVCKEKIKCDIKTIKIKERGL
jgi:hypothetical protein